MENQDEILNLRKKIIDNFCNSSALKEYLSKTINSVEELFILNGINRIINNYTGRCLKIIFGEATQNLNNYIYYNGLNSSNTFLNPTTLSKKYNNNEKLTLQGLQDLLASQGVLVIDVFAIPLPSEIYRKNGVQLDDELQKQYIQHKVKLIIELCKNNNINKVRCINRYSIKAVEIQSEYFLEYFKIQLKSQNYEIDLEMQLGGLSDGAGNLDIKKYSKFIE